MYNIEGKEEIFTSIVRIKGNENHKVVPVKSTQPINISLWIDLSKVISRIYVSIPIKVGDLICKNIMNTGIDIICTKDIH